MNVAENLASNCEVIEFLQKHLVGGLYFGRKIKRIGYYCGNSYDLNLDLKVLLRNGNLRELLII